MSMIQKHSFSITSCNKDHDRAWEAPKVYSFTSPSQLPLYVFSNQTYLLTGEIVPGNPLTHPDLLRVFCVWVRLEKNPGDPMKAVFPRLLELYNVQLSKKKKKS